MTPEARVKNAIKKWLDSHGFWRAGAKRPEGTIHGWYTMPVSNGMGVHGIPDFRCVYKGLSFDIEAKAPKGEATPNQLQRHAEIREAGGFVVILSDAAMLADVITELEAHGRRLGREIFGAGCEAGTAAA